MILEIRNWKFGARLRIVAGAVVFLTLIARDGLGDVGQQADEILKLSGVKGGLCVHLGVTDGKLTAALGKGRHLVVHGLGVDAAVVKKARATIRDQKVYGQVSVEQASFKTLPYAKNLVNLVVVEDLPALLGNGLSLKEVFRVLAPRGVLCSGGKADAGKLTAAGFKDVKTSGKWSVATKPFPKDMDEWTHWRHGADGNHVSRDRVDVPNALRWHAGPMAQVGGHYFGGNGIVSANGRLFYTTTIGVETSSGRGYRRFLIARDAHNGLLLWKKPVSVGSDYIPRSSSAWNVAAGDRLYTVLKAGEPLVALDGATGAVARKYEGETAIKERVYHDGALVLLKATKDKAPQVRCVDARSGALRWATDLNGKNLLVGDGQVFALVSGATGPTHLVSLDLKTGKDRWRTSLAPWRPSKDKTKAVPKGGNIVSLCFYKDGVLGLIPNDRNEAGGLHVFSAKNGKHLWGFSYPLLGHGGRSSKVFHGESVHFTSMDYGKRSATWKFDLKTGKNGPFKTKQKNLTEVPFLITNTGVLAEMWTSDVYKGARLSMWWVDGISARIFAFDDKRVYGFGVLKKKGPESLFRRDRQGGKKEPVWKSEFLVKDRKTPRRIGKAIIQAGDAVWIAGRLNNADPMGSQLQAYSVSDGKKLGEQKLPAMPVYDGLAAARGHLYVSCVDGNVLCFGKK